MRSTGQGEAARGSDANTAEAAAALPRGCWAGARRSSRPPPRPRRRRTCECHSPSRGEWRSAGVSLCLWCQVWPLAHSMGSPVAWGFAIARGGVWSGGKASRGRGPSTAAQHGAPAKAVDGARPRRPSAGAPGAPRPRPLLRRPGPTLKGERATVGEKVLQRLAGGGGGGGNGPGSCWRARLGGLQGVFPGRAGDPRQSTHHRAKCTPGRVRPIRGA